jgi:hypothetical protein
VLSAGPRGTLRLCLNCHHRVTPAGVQRPYEGGDGQIRRVRTQTERDDEALALAERTGILLAAISATLADDRLHVTTRARLEWFASEIRDAGKAGHADRVAVLTERLASERIRRQHWWNGEGKDPIAAVHAGDAEDILDAELDENDSPIAIAAAPAVDFPAELAARGWMLHHPGDGRCHIVREDGSDCPGRAEHVIPGGAICDRQYQALLTPLTRRP